MIFNFAKQKFTFFILFTFIAVSSFSSCTEKKLSTIDIHITKQDGSSVVVNAEIAKTPQQREKGFMNRKKIPSGTGMIFVFEVDQVLHFWMKNTPVPLSIAYIDSKGVIRDIFDMRPFSLVSVDSTCSVRYALEVPKGWFSENGIKPGDKIAIPF